MSKMWKRAIALVVAVTSVFAGTLNVSAEGVKDVFDAKYYADANADLKVVYGYDEKALFNHYMTSGLSEGRCGSPTFNVAEYRKAYPDLEAKYGDNWDAYVKHYFAVGKAEGRTAGVTGNVQAAGARAVSVKADDIATEQNVLEVLSLYDADAYHIMKTEADSGLNFMKWFEGQSVISGMDTAVHETYHGYTHDQSNLFLGNMIYLGSGKSYDVDNFIAYYSGFFTKTEEMGKQIPPELRTFRYDYIAPGAPPTANVESVFGMLDEFTAYYWGLETMNSLSQFLIDTKAGEDAWRKYVNSIYNNMTAYAEFKYWTLRYMMYIRSANPKLYQEILNNENYCAAYRDAEMKFVSEIARSREIINNSAEYLRSLGCSVEWSDTEICLWHGRYRRVYKLRDYNVLMAETQKPEYIEMDSILKHY